MKSMTTTDNMIHGTVELRTGELVLRRFTLEDAEALYEKFGSDPEMYRYSGWNPYATPEMAQETVRRFIDSYPDPRSYSWAIDLDGTLVGTVGAYDFVDDRIEVGLSIARNCWGRGFATQALQAVLPYLTGQEGISTVTAWCAPENVGSRRAMEKAGMHLACTRPAALEVAGETYDQMVYEYQK